MRECRVVFEDCPQAQWVASIVRPLAAEVQVANPSRIPWLFRDGRKNDRLDARKLATLLSLDQVTTVHLPRAEVSVWRSMINHRRTLVGRRTQVKNQIRSVLRATMTACPFRSCWSARGRRWLGTLIQTDERNGLLCSLRAELDFLDGQCRTLEGDLDQIAARQPAVALLRSIPGVGPRTAEAIVAHAGDVRRFGDRRQFASYFGMTPTQDASGKIDRHGHISKRGPSVVRWVLIQAAHQAIRHSPVVRGWYGRVQWARKDRTKKAVVATGRKLLTVMFAMLRDGTRFDPARWQAKTAA
jgi:transposase